MYDLRIADTIADLTENFTTARQVLQSEIITGDLSKPQEFGSTEIFVIKVDIEEDEDTKSYAFAIQAWDEANRASEVSNVVRATLRAYIPPTLGPPTDGLSVGAIIGIVCGAVGGILVILVVVLLIIKLTVVKDNKEKRTVEDQKMQDNTGYKKDAP